MPPLMGWLQLFDCNCYAANMSLHMYDCIAASVILQLFYCVAATG